MQQSSQSHKIKKSNFPCPIILFPLLAGAGIYLSCRKERLLYERAISLIQGARWEKVKPILNSTCERILPTEFAHHVFTYSLPNALWTFSLCLFIERNLKRKNDKNQSRRMAIYCIIAISPDLLQLSGNLPGTFDPIDVVTAIAAATMAVTFSKWIPRRRSNMQ